MATNRYQQYLKALKKPFQKLTKLEFLQPDGSAAFALTNKQVRGYNNAHKSTAFVQSGTLDVSMQNGVRRKATITLSNLDRAFDYNVNKIWFGQQIRLSMGLVLPDGTDFYLPQMVGEIQNPQVTFKPNQQTITFPLVDKWANLDGTLGGQLVDAYKVEINSNIFKAIIDLLHGSRKDYATETTDVTQMIDNVAPVFTNYYDNLTYSAKYSDGTITTDISYLVTPYTLTQDEGGTLADVILELNTMLVGIIGYDSTGALRIEPSQENVSDLDKPVLWQFTPQNSQLLAIDETIKNTEVRNNVIVVGDSTASGVVWGQASNYDPTSDTNINVIGLKSYYESGAGLWSATQCVDMAKYLLKTKTVLQKSINISSAQMFHLIENRLISVVRTDKDGSPVEKHLINSFSIPLAETGEMTINATSVLDVPNFTTTQFPSIGTYTITVNATNCTVDTSSDATIKENGEATIRFNLSSGFSLPLSGISVTNASIKSYDGINKLVIDNPTGSVTIDATGTAAQYIISLNLSNCTYSGDSGVSVDQSASGTLTPTRGYSLPSKVTYNGATVTYDQSTGAVTFSAPTGNVSLACTATWGWTAAQVESATTLSNSIDCNVGDLIVAAIATRDVLTLPDDWTLLQTSEVNSADTTNGQRLSFAYKYAEAQTEELTATQASAQLLYLNLVCIHDYKGAHCTGFEYDNTGVNSATTLTMSKPDGAVLWGLSAPVWETATPYTHWTASNDAEYLGESSPSYQPRLGTFEDLSTDSNVTFTIGSGTSGSTIIGGAVEFLGTYEIIYNLTNCTGATSNPTFATQGDGFTATLTADDGCTLPESIVLHGWDEYSWNAETGVLKVNATTVGEVDVIYVIVNASSLPQLDNVTNLSVTDTTATFTPAENATSYEFFVDGVSIGEVEVE